MRAARVVSAMFLMILATSVAEAARRRPIVRPEPQGESSILIATRVTGNNVRLSLLFSADEMLRNVVEFPWGPAAIWPYSTTPYPGRILAIRGTEIVIFDLVAGSVTNILPISGESPTWAPDGRAIVYSQRIPEHANRSDLFIVEIDSLTATVLGNPHRLTETPDRAESGASWSPDGSMLTARVLTDDRIDLYLFTLASDRSSVQSARALTAYMEKPVISTHVWSRSPSTSSAIFYSGRDRQHESRDSLHFVEPASGRHGILVSDPSRSLLHGRLAPDGETMVFTAAIDGDHEVFALENVSAVMNGSAPPALRALPVRSGGEIYWVDDLLWVQVKR